MGNVRNRLVRLGAVAVSAGLVAAMLVLQSPAEASGGVTVVSAGQDNVCALTTSGGVQCWGNSAYGAMGDGTSISRDTPAVIPGLKGGIAQVSVGYYTSCAVTTVGGVKCWGDNANGEVGNGTFTHAYEPVDVSGLTSGVSQVSAGTGSTCAVTTVGGVKCWGSNGVGQLGDGSFTDRNTPINVFGLTSGVTQVSVGGGHTCALTTVGGVKCWGHNSSGELGDGTFTDRSTLVSVSGLTSGVAQISAGYDSTCAITTAGGLKCWGFNGSGKLGDGTLTERDTPVDVYGLTSGVAQVSTGNFQHTCALTTVGGVKCWGYNGLGQLGDGTITNSKTPVDVLGLTTGAAQVSTGSYFTCAVTTAGGTKCWGAGDLGDGTFTGSHTPVDAVGFTVTTTNLKLAKLSLPQGATETFTIKVTAGGTNPKARLIYTSTTPPSTVVCSDRVR